jgi:hypothetical protein
MLKIFSKGQDGHAWPLSRIVAALKAQYHSIEPLGEDGPIKVFGIEDNGVNFVIAVVQSTPSSGEIVEIGFFARFVGFPVTSDAVDRLNRNLHISVASLEGADLFLMAGLQVSGPYDDGQFALLIESWRRDLAVTLLGIGGKDASVMEAFPAAKLAAVREFAVNRAPSDASGGLPKDLFMRFMGAKAASQMMCDDCDGRGKRGLIARRCATCDGTGFVSAGR